MNIEDLIWKCLIRDMHIIVRKDLKLFLHEPTQTRIPWGTTSCAPHIWSLLQLFTKWNALPDFASWIHKHMCNKIVRSNLAGSNLVCNALGQLQCLQLKDYCWIYLPSIFYYFFHNNQQQLYNVTCKKYKLVQVVVVKRGYSTHQGKINQRFLDNSQIIIILNLHPY